MSEQRINAIHAKHQTMVNRFIAWDEKYNQIVDATEDSNSRRQEHAYNRAFECFHCLPKREQLNIAKHCDTAGY